MRRFPFAVKRPRPFARTAPPRSAGAEINGQIQLRLPRIEDKILTMKFLCAPMAELLKQVGLAGAVLLAISVAGCSTFSNYPSGMEQTTLSPLRSGRKTGCQGTFKKHVKSGKEQVLFSLEMGRVTQLEGDFAASRAAFEMAIAATQAQDDKAEISASGATSQGAAVLVNDKAIPYRAPSFERILAHHYQALNYLAEDDLMGAGVEVRLANREQEDARKLHDREVAKAEAKAKGKASDCGASAEGGEGDPSMANVYAGLNNIAGAVRFSFQNAATFFVSSVIWEMLGERNDAYIDCKKALEIFPDNFYLQLDVVRLGKRLGMREDLADFERRFPRALKMPADGSEALAGKARLVVIYEEGLVPKKSEFSLPYPLPGGAIGAFALPMYTQFPPPPEPLAVSVDNRRLGGTAMICDVNALAARALAERMPGIIARQVVRAVAKGMASKVAKDQAGELGALAMSIYNVASEQADLRSWLTLPANIQIFSTWHAPGRRTVELAATNGGNLWSGEVTLEPGKTTMLYVTGIDMAVFSHVFVQP